MTPQEASRLINESVFHPLWRIRATYLGPVVLGELEFQTYDSSSISVDGIYWERILMGPTFAFKPEPDWTEDDVLYQVLREIDKQNAHESREFLRTRRNGRWVAPFHPHNDGTEVEQKARDKTEAKAKV